MSIDVSSLHLRPQGLLLKKRMEEPRRFVQIVLGPRQVGKTTLIQILLDRLSLPFHYASADEPTLKGPGWIEQEWSVGRIRAGDRGKQGGILALDEIQKIGQWSETVKRLWDEDTRQGVPLRVILSGSSSLLLQKGLTESLAGRFELVRLPHWSYSEMREVFGFSLDQYLYFGGYPGAASLVSDPVRWSDYIRNSLIETTLSRDILLMARVDKPALLRRLLLLACTYSGQILSYNKMLGQLQDVGNTTTLAHYLDLLDGAGLVAGLQKFSGDVARRRGSIPKLLVRNTALMTSLSGLAFEEARADRTFWGRLVESAVGAHLLNGIFEDRGDLFYFREGSREVDYVLKAGRKILTIEVKSGGRPMSRDGLLGMEALSSLAGSHRRLLVGGEGLPLEDFLSEPPTGLVARLFGRESAR